MSAVFVDKENSVTYKNSSDRRNEWLSLIPETNEDVYNFTPSKIDFLAPLQQIYYGAPGTGKSHEIKEQTAEAEEQGRVFRTTFHPDSDYSTFVGCYKPTISQKAVRNVAGDVVKKDGKEVFEDYISYQFVPQAFTNAYVKAWQTDEPVFLIIEEINRGNCAQIFGDLFQLLDRGDDGVSDYPIKADTDLCQYLKKELGEGHDGIKDDKICLPRNLHIWATMNTSDQSLFPIDSAFKRRWDWHYTPICNAKKGWKVEANGNQYDWWDFLQKINERIERATSSEDKQLGYFFCKPDCNGVISAEKFVSKVIFYLWNDVFKDFADSSDDLFKVADGNRMTFRTFYTADDNGKTIVNEDNVEALLGSLGVVSTFIDADELENSNGVKGFLINGEVEKVMMHVPSKVVSLYVEKNPDLSAAEIVSIWNTLETKGQYVFTSEEIQQKKTASIDEKLLGRYDPLSLKNGETIYVWNQMIQERIDDFSKKVNAQSWGIHIEPIV
ncbi:MAG: AAA family ATPase [Bacteroidaceae bacterium]|nr:AAA family ATPase [Bacteroidaceae bacterium]